MKKFVNILWLITKGAIKLIIAWNIICAFVAQAAMLIDFHDTLGYSLWDAGIKTQDHSWGTLYNTFKKNWL